MSIQPFIESVEAELLNLQERLSVNLAFEHELRDDLVGFQAGSSAESGPEQVQRHREWFLLERPSEQLGSVPIELFQEGLDAGQIADSALTYASLRGSRLGVFLVSRIAQTDGLVLEDLLGRGTYAIPDPSLAVSTEVGDLVVGRIYPEDLSSDGERTNWGISSAATMIRNDQLVKALRSDLQAMHGRSRGPLRMSQLDIEEMFFSEQIRVSESKANKSEPTRQELTDRATSMFTEAGIDAAQAGEYLQVLRANPMPPIDLALGGEDPLGWLLDELAFTSNLELNAARRILSEYWRAVSIHESSPETVGEPELGETQKKSALERFEEGRKSGLDLDQLFANLESDLGVELEEEEDGGGAPDFPGVLGALVQEFLWDGARMAEVDLDEFAHNHRELELFAQFGVFMGHADELGTEHVELFLGRWIWEAGRLAQGSYSAERAVAVTSTFCAWFSEHQTKPVAEELSSLLVSLGEEAPRIQGLNEELGLTQHTEPTAFFEFVGLANGASRWLDQYGGALEVPLDEVSKQLKSGDMVAGQHSADRLTYQAIYPAFAAPYLKATS